MSETTVTCPQCATPGKAGGFCGRCGSTLAAAEVGETTTLRSMMTPPTFTQPPPAYSPPMPAAPSSFSPPAVAAAAPAAYAQNAATAPGVTLIPGEVSRLDTSFSPNLIFKHLRTRVILTDRRIIVQWPHTLFGVIPMGYALGSAPLDAVGQINHGHMMNSRQVAFGAIAAVFGLVVMAEGSYLLVGGLLALAIGVVMMLTARRTGIFFDTGGNHLLTASGRGGDIQNVERTAEVIIAAVQSAHDGR